ncbi:YetF domain-containing protein [Luedemannella flava]
MKSQPTLLLRDGEMLVEAMTRERVAPEEVRQAVRARGIGGLEKVTAVILETDGSFSVVPASGMGSGTALDDVASRQ